MMGQNTGSALRSSEEHRKDSLVSFLMKCGRLVEPRAGRDGLNLSLEWLGVSEESFLDNPKFTFDSTFQMQKSKLRKVTQLFKDGAGTRAAWF